MIVIAQQDQQLQQIVNKAQLVTPDGAGLLWASKVLGSKISKRVSGVDLVAQLCKGSSERGYSCYFLGAAPGVAEDAANNLKERYPNMHVAGVHHGYFTAEEEPQIVQTILDAAPQVLFVAFGIPKQEKFIAAHLGKLNGCVAIGIGGSFDVYAGLVRRAPKWMQKAGIEWLFRLIQDPKKISKVRALPRFALMTLRYRFFGK